MKNKNDINADLKAAMRANLRDELKAELEEVESEISGKRKIIPFRKWLAIAAGIALFVLAGLYFISNSNSNSQQDNTQLFADYFEPFDNVILPVNRSKNDTTNLTSIQEAYMNYEAENYEKSTILFENIKAKFPTNLDNEFYLALSHLGANNAEKAEVILEKLSTKSDFRFSQQAEWYLGLTYLKMEKIEKAKTIFLKISKEKTTNFAAHPFSTEANEILEML